MFKKHKKTLILTSIIILLPMVAGLFLWNRLPDTMATHWGTNGEPNGWSSKLFAVVGLPLFLVACQWLCMFLSAADPKKQNILGSKMFGLMLWIVPVVSVICSTAILLEGLGIRFPVETVIPLLLGGLFMVIGFFMPSCPPSYTIGIKLPWTLADEENWRKTHRLAGGVWIIGGAMCALTALLPVPFLMIAPLAAMIIIPTAYSYLLYRKSSTKH